MALESPPESLAYRVTLFFGPESVEGEPATQASVFNVKKRSWKAGIQVSVEIGRDQLSTLSRNIRLNDRLSEFFMTLAPDERLDGETRVADLFAQAVSRCKLDLKLHTGLTQENQRILCTELVPELNQAVAARTEYVIAYILTELDFAPDRSSPSSH